MAWSIIHNSEPNLIKEDYSGVCPLTGKTTNITVHYVGNKWCKTDLQKTYRKSGMTCSILQEEGKVDFSPCMESCPLIPDKCLK